MISYNFENYKSFCQENFLKPGRYESLKKFQIAVKGIK